MPVRCTLLTVQIADFGMSRNLDDGDYYTSKNAGPIPVRWTAQEVSATLLTMSMRLKVGYWYGSMFRIMVFKYRQQQFRKTSVTKTYFKHLLVSNLLVLSVSEFFSSNGMI